MAEGGLLSLSLDEYTALGNKRYMNVNVHTNHEKFWNIGMIGISGNFTAEKWVEKVEEKLSEFQLSLQKNIVGCVTDGAGVMVKFGKLINSEHQLCYAHGIHLAICDVLYQKISDPDAREVTESTSEIEDNNRDDHDSDIDDTSETYDSSISLCSESNLGCTEINKDLFSHNNVDIRATIAKVRKIVRMIRKSPLKNESLQNYVNPTDKKELTLILDSKTRWNSLVTMIDGFLTLRSAVQKTMIDFKILIKFSEDEISALDNIVHALKPVEIGSQELCSRGATILSAEGIFSFILNELSKQNTVFSKNVMSALCVRINQRRNTSIIGLLKYIRKGNKYSKLSTAEQSLAKLAPLPSRSGIITTMKRLTSTYCDTCELSLSSESSQSEPDDEGLSLVQKMEKQIKKQAKPANQISATTGGTINLKKVQK